MRKIIITSLLFFSVFFALSSVAEAQPVSGRDSSPPVSGRDSNPGPGLDIKIENPFKAEGGDSLFSFLRLVINNIVMPIGGVLAVLSFIYSGFLYVTAQGNQTKLQTAHKALLYTSIGTAVLLGAWVFANVICQTIGQLGNGVICPTNDLPSRSIQVAPSTAPTL